MFTQSGWTLYGGAQCVYRTWKRITPRLVLVDPTWGILCLNQLHTCCMYVEKINIRMRRWKKKLQRRSKLWWEEKEELLRCEDQHKDEKMQRRSLEKKVAHRPIVILTLYCVRRLHMQLKQVDVFLERSEAKGLEERVFYLLFLLMFICYLPARTCFYLLFFLLVICSLPFLFPLFAIGYLLFAWMNV